MPRPGRRALVEALACRPRRGARSRASPCGRSTSACSCRGCRSWWCRSSSRGLPSGLSGPGGTCAGSSGFSARIEAGTVQVGSARFSPTRNSPSGVGSAASPTATAIDVRAGLHAEVVEAHLRHVQHQALGRDVRQHEARRELDDRARLGDPLVHARVDPHDGLEAEPLAERDVEQRVVRLDQHAARGADQGPEPRRVGARGCARRRRLRRRAGASVSIATWSRRRARGARARSSRHRTVSNARVGTAPARSRSASRSRARGPRRRRPARARGAAPPPAPAAPAPVPGPVSTSSASS